MELFRNKGIEMLYSPGSQPSLPASKIVAKALGIKRGKIERLESLDLGLWQGMLVEEVRHTSSRRSIVSGRSSRRTFVRPTVKCSARPTIAPYRVGEAVETPQGRGDRAGRAEPLLSLARRFIAHGELGDLWKAPNGHGRIEVLTVEPEEVLAAGV